MGRFGCFYGHVHSHKQKKAAQPSFETMIKMLQLGSQNHSPVNSIDQTTSREFSLVNNESSYMGIDSEHPTLTARGCKSREWTCECDAESNADSVYFENRNLRRSLSVGCELDQKGGTFGDKNSDGCIDQGFSCEGSLGCSETAEVLAPSVAKSAGTTLPDQDQEALQFGFSYLNSNLVNHGSTPSVCDPNYFEKEGHEDSLVPLSTECADGCRGETFSPATRISKSCSMPNFRSTSPTSPGLCPQVLVTRNRSFEDLNLLGIKKGDSLAQDADAAGIARLPEDDSFYQCEKFDGENAVVDNYDSYDYGCSSKDWIVPEPDELSIIKHGQGESSSTHWGHFPNEDFKIKRIEDWVIDLQHCGHVEETNEIADSQNEVKGHSAILEGVDRAEMKINPSMEAAKRYISSLNATATAAQLANHGLVAIPLLNAFVSLKVLNLSGNSIVRITAGALPRGLHMLNLSKNKLSTIEGLKELTRLRVLDLSYNKISRIGHGLAYCSSLKEVYLAGNKISEVEGLHRLLKLAVLDLRFNKIATSKCLGQLAANYNSLQAISLEGNPAQKNVGDDQLKKCLQGLLPHLAYYNRQHIKTSTLKDSSDRSVRLGILAHQFDRGVRSDHKSSSRRGSYGGGAKRSSHSSSHGIKGQASDSMKQSRARQRLVPPSGSRMSHHHNHFDIGNKLQSLRAGFLMHKSQSAGNLAAV